MATTISRLAIALGLDPSGMRKGTQQARGMLDGLRGSIAGIGASLSAAFGGLSLAGIAGWGVKLAAEAETAAIQLEVLTGSAESARDIIADMRSFAAATPFEMSHLQDAANMLLAFGANATEVMPTVRMLGDVAGGNADKLNRLALAFGQIQAAGRLTGQDLLQLINAGFNPLQEISRQTGISIGDLRDKMQEGAITFDMVRDAFMAVTSEGGRFHGMMDRMSETLSGRFGRLRESIAQLARNFGELLLPSMQAIVDKGLELTDWLKGLDTVTVGNTARLVAFTGAFVAALAIIPRIIAAITAIVKALRTMATAQAVVQALAGPKGWAVLATSLAVAAGAAFTVDQMFQDYTKSLEQNAAATGQNAEQAKTAANEIADSFKALTDDIENTNNALEKMRQRGAAMAEALRTPAEVLKDGLAEALELMQQGAITAETYRRQVAKLGQDFFEASQQKNRLESMSRGVGAATRDSTAGFSAVHAAQREMEERKRANAVAKAQRDQMNRNLERIHDEVSKPKVNVVSL